MQILIDVIILLGRYTSPQLKRYQVGIIHVRPGNDVYQVANRLRAIPFNNVLGVGPKIFDPLLPTLVKNTPLPKNVLI